MGDTHHEDPDDGDGERRRICLLFGEDRRLGQVVSQPEKLNDVLAVQERRDYDQGVFARLERFARDGERGR